MGGLVPEVWAESTAGQEALTRLFSGQGYDASLLPELEKAEAQPTTPPEPRPRRLRHKKPAPAQVDALLRSRFHVPLRVQDANERGINFRVNRNWVSPIASTHQQLFRLLLLFFDVSLLVAKDKMSTTVLEELKREIVVSTSIPTINEDLYSVYSGRHFLVITREKTLREKTNWARKQVSDIRLNVPDYRQWSTAQQVDRLAEGLHRAMREPQDARRRAVASLADTIYVDSRSVWGRPTAWHGMPVNPKSSSRAWLQRRDHDWTLWVEAGGVRQTDLDQLHPHVVHSRLLTERPIDEWWINDSIRQTMTSFPERREVTSKLSLTV